MVVQVSVGVAMQNSACANHLCIEINVWVEQAGKVAVVSGSPVDHRGD